MSAWDVVMLETLKENGPDMSELNLHNKLPYTVQLRPDDHKSTCSQYCLKFCCS